MLSFLCLGLNVSISAGQQPNKGVLQNQAGKAVLKDDLKTLESTAKHGLDVKLPLAGGYTLLHYAAQYKAHRCLAYLIKQGCPLNAVTEETGFTALHFCALSSNEKDAGLLLKAGAKSNIKSKNDKLTAFDVALKIKPLNASLVELLSKGSRR